MSRFSIFWRSRSIWAAATVLTLLTGYALTYQVGMATLEGTSVSYLQALQVVIESITTAGFGGNAPWESDFMNLLIIAMNMTGVLLVFLALPLFVTPMFKRALQDTPPTTTDCTNHVIIGARTSNEDVLRNELEAASVPYLVVEDDRDALNRLKRNDINVIWGRIEEHDTLEAARLAEARALVIDADGKHSAAAILSAKHVHPEAPVITVVEDDDVARYHRYAGADHIVRPRQVMGTRLAQKAATSISAELHDSLALDNDLELTELLVQPGSDLAGTTLADSGLRDETGVTIIGLWNDGQFIPSPDPQHRLEPHTILVAASNHDRISALKLRTASPQAHPPEHVIIGGYGVVGQHAARMLERHDIPYTIIDRTDQPGVDVVGNIADEDTLRLAGTDTADAFILALDDDTTSMYAALVLRHMNPDLELVARANRTEIVPNLYRAGADYVLALPTVTGRMIFSLLMQDEQALSPGTQFNVIRISAPRLAGQSLGHADVRARTGCTVVAAERDGHLLRDLGPDFVVQSDDCLLVAGSDEALNRFVSMART
ncbi:MAG: potassium channel family protein [Bacteroidota bacterium]